MLTRRLPQCRDYFGLDRPGPEHEGPEHDQSASNVVGVWSATRSQSVPGQAGCRRLEEILSRDWVSFKSATRSTANGFCRILIRAWYL